MDEYIEREVACKDCIHYDICIFHPAGNENKKCVHFKNKANVVEVRHGKWRMRKAIIFDSELVGYNCSECNTTWDTETNYCPNCGAYMRGEKSGKE